MQLPRREALNRADGAERGEPKNRVAARQNRREQARRSLAPLSLFRIKVHSRMLKPKYFLYACKSTEDDDKQVMSIEAQLFELREFAHKENLEILTEFQESKSAKTPG